MTEPLLTEQEREKLCETLEDMSAPSSFRVTNPTPAIAAKEIRGLAEEAERRKRELASTLGVLYRECERRAKAEADAEYWKRRAGNPDESFWSRWGARC